MSATSRASRTERDKSRSRGKVHIQPPANSNNEFSRKQSRSKSRDSELSLVGLPGNGIVATKLRITVGQTTNEHTEPVRSASKCSQVPALNKKKSVGKVSCVPIQLGLPSSQLTNEHTEPVQSASKRSQVPALNKKKTVGKVSCVPIQLPSSQLTNEHTEPVQSASKRSQVPALNKKKTVGKVYAVNKKKSYSNEQLKAAIADAAGGVSLRKVSLKWSIPRTTLQNCKRAGFKVLSPRPGPQPVLTLSEEQLLVDWLTELARRGIPIQKHTLFDSIQKILKDDPRPNPFVNDRPGKGWFKAFLKRHPQLAERHAESICRGRGSLTEGCIRGWFEDAQKFFTEHGCEYILSSPTKQYNGDETGFQIDPKSGKVLGPKQEVLYTESGGRKEQISVLVTTRADGTVTSPAIVYPYKRAVPKDIVDHVPETWHIARSESGWMTSDIFFEYLANCFIPELAAARRREKRLNAEDELILDDNDWVVYWIDGYSSHLTVHTSKLCEVNHIWLYCFKAHASHVCQPNDVGPFKPLKSEWRQAVTDWRVSHPYDVLTRAQFAPLLMIALQKLDAASVTSGYRATGLFPFDSNAVHYERLTATNRSKFDSRAFPPSDGAALDFVNALKCMEYIMGEEVVKAYKYAINSETESYSSILPNVNAFILFKQLHFYAHGNPVGDQDCIGLISGAMPLQSSHSNSQQWDSVCDINNNVSFGISESELQQVMQDTDLFPGTVPIAEELSLYGVIMHENIASTIGMSTINMSELNLSCTLSVWKHPQSDDTGAVEKQSQTTEPTNTEQSPAEPQSQTNEPTNAELQAQTTEPLNADLQSHTTEPTNAEQHSVKSSNDVKIVGNGTPNKIQRGVPIWYQGKVSPAFENHLFWPSPPKKKGKCVQPSGKILFPACASSAQWRELHRQRKMTMKPPARSARKTTSKPSMQGVCDFTSTVMPGVLVESTEAISATQLTEKPQQQTSNQLLTTTNPERKRKANRSKESCDRLKTVQVRSKRARKSAQTCSDTAVVSRSTTASSSAVWKCHACLYVYGAKDDPKTLDDWLTCVGCDHKYHETCAEDDGVVDDDSQFTCRHCLE